MSSIGHVHILAWFRYNKLYTLLSSLQICQRSYTWYVWTNIYSMFVYSLERSFLGNIDMLDLSIDSFSLSKTRILIIISYSSTNIVVKCVSRVVSINMYYYIDILEGGSINIGGVT